MANYGKLWPNSTCPVSGGPNYFDLGHCLELRSQIIGKKDCPQIVPEMKNWLNLDKFRQLGLNSARPASGGPNYFGFWPRPEVTDHTYLQP